VLPLAAEKCVYHDLSLELFLLLLQLVVHVLEDVLDVSLGDEADLTHLLLLLGGQLPLLQDGQDCLKNNLSFGELTPYSYLNCQFSIFCQFLR
jgi:hypothetical protein